MSTASKRLFDSLDTWARLEEMISNAEAESTYYECKAPREPKMGKEMRLHLAKACSGFANTNGGILLYGVSTTKHAHSGLDVMTQLEPIGDIKNFAQQIENTIPSLSIPVLSNYECKIIREKPTDTRGILLVHLPKSDGDPVQSTADDIFYFRSGDDFVVVPYEMVKRLFAATDSPDLRPFSRQEIIKKDANGYWEIPMPIENLSSAIAEHSKIVITVKNPELFAGVSATIPDASGVNPGGHKTFIGNINDAIHKDLGHLAATLKVKLKDDDPTRGIIPFTIKLLANKMQAKVFRVSLNIKDGGISSCDIQEGES